jgi:PAS domain S-box-containing protein
MKSSGEKNKPVTNSNFRFIKPLFPSESVSKISSPEEYAFFRLFEQNQAIMLLLEPQEDGNHKILDANPAACLFYGYSKEEILKLSIADFSIKSPEIRKENMRKALNSRSTTFIFQHRLANKEIRELNVIASPLEIGNKKLVFVIEYDITEGQSLLRKIKNKQAYNKMLFELSPVGLFLMELDGTIVDGNKAALEIIGEEKEILIGLNLFHSELLSEENRTQFLKDLKKRELANFPDLSSDYYFKRKDGSSIYIRCKGELITYQDKPYFLGSFIDISHQKQDEIKLQASENKYSNLADFTFEWEYWVNPEGKYSYISPSCEKTTGYPASAFEENPLLLVEITHPDFKQIVRKHLKEELENHLPHQMEFKIVNKAGEEVWIEHQCRPIYDSNQHYLGKRGINRNITKEKQAYEELLRSNERFKNLSDLTFEGILFHQNGIIKDVNHALENLSGYKREEAIGHGLTEFIQNDNFKSVILKNMRKKHALPYEGKLIKKDGSLLAVEIEGKDYWMDGEVVRAVAIRDISEKKKTLSKLQFLTKALNNSKEVVFTCDINGIINYINLEFTHLYGYTEEEVINKVSPRILKSGNTSDEEYKIYWKKIRAKESVSTTYVNKTKSGQLLHIEASADPILDEDDTLIGFLAIQRDISERIKQENRQAVVTAITSAVLQDHDLDDLLQIIQFEINKLMDASNFYFAFYDNESDSFTTPYFSDEYDSMTEFPANGSLTGYMIRKNKALRVNKSEIEKFIEEAKIEAIGEIPAQWLGVPLIINNEVTGAFAIQSYSNPKAYGAEDKKILEIIASQISLAIDRKKKEEELRTALAKAQESDRLKSTFLATMSHELRTPLNAIIGFSDLADNERSKEEIIKFCQIIHKSGTHLLGIVNEVFDFTLIDTGEMKLYYEEHKLKEIFDDLYQIIQKEQLTLHKEDIKLSYHMPESYQDVVFITDKQRFQQVFINLLKNALKFTDKGSIEFGFSALEEDYLQFFVKDSGIGIAKDKQDIIFDIFRQADDSHTRKHDGVGLGLSISKKIISQMQGSIWVESTLGKGTNFYFKLPFNSQTLPSKQPLIERKKKKKLKVNAHSILIAEDDAVNFSLIKSMLESLKLELIWAKDGKEAIDIVEENPEIDLILMDIRMPILNGLEASKIIKKAHPNLPIIAQTAYAISGDRELALQAGCDNYISKPIQKSLLFDLIKKYLD